jgi:L-alanine-DL-glutamate epimerase-like enolase superfamily enzyme
MSRIERIDLKRVRKPLRITFSTAAGKKDHMESLIIRVLLDTKEEGLGESPTSRAFPLETLEVMEDVIRKVIPLFIGKEIRESLPFLAKLRRDFPGHVLSFSGFEVALFRAYLSLCHLSEFSFWGGKSRILETDITIPNVDLQKAKKWALKFLKKRFRFFKIKLIGDIERDIDFLRAISETLSRKGEGDHLLRLDMNESYNARDFLVFLEKLSKFRIPVQLVEQPLRRDDYNGLREIVKESRIEIVLDESVKSAEDLDRIGSTGFRGGVNMKIAKSGLMESKRIYDMARKNGLKLMIGCMMETILGLSTAIFLALGLGDFEYVDLDGIHFLRWKKPFSEIDLSGPYYIYSGS